MFGASKADRAAGPAADEPADWQAPTWEELVRDHSDMVYRVALRLTGNAPDAEDLTQEVFIRAFKSIHKFEPGTLNGWLHRITTNLFLDGARRNKRIRFDPMAEAQERVPSSARGPAEAMLDTSLDHDVARALADLSPDHRVAVVLCDIEGLSYEEIAQILDIKIGAVRSRIHRGREGLRRSLAHRRPADGHQYIQGAPDERPGEARDLQPDPALAKVLKR
ncbi:RNA polymerase sigma factor SigE [Propionibacteriaceae bacterium Y1923]|uniref:RNA polymerase sigma factor SigE n=1 Tax=Aestuariimicrobium sp. Y1814 TaxID=3418742 RepID=UPI003C13BE6D